MVSARGGPVGDSVQVLVVDDDAPIREFLRVLLEEAGYAVFEAIDGRAALETLRSGSEPGMVVITSHSMPGLDGPGLITAVLANPLLTRRHAYIYVAVAGWTLSPGLLQQLRQLDAPVLRKPFALDQFLAAVVQAAERVSAAARLASDYASV
jgi:CheY-like chemotaxis protein